MLLKTEGHVQKFEGVATTECPSKWKEVRHRDCMTMKSVFGHTFEFAFFRKRFFGDKSSEVFSGTSDGEGVGDIAKFPLLLFYIQWRTISPRPFFLLVEMTTTLI